MEPFLGLLRTVGDPRLWGWYFTGIGVWLMAKGLLVPRSYLEDARADRDGWRDAFNTVVERIRLLSDQTGDIADGMKTFEQFIKALPTNEQQQRRNPRQGGR